MSKPNFTIKDKDTNKTYWISRAVVVIPVVFKIKNDVIYTLVEKRGKSVSHTGKYCCPCGYLDWDETFEQACVREVQEETGISVPLYNIKFHSYNSVPDNSDNQNVSVRFMCMVDDDTELDMSKIETKDEVDELKWVECGTIMTDDQKSYVEINQYNLNIIDWAFNHDKIIVSMLRDLFTKLF